MQQRQKQKNIGRGRVRTAATLSVALLAATAGTLSPVHAQGTAGGTGTQNGTGAGNGTGAPQGAPQAPGTAPVGTTPGVTGGPVGGQTAGTGGTSSDASGTATAVSSFGTNTNGQQTGATAPTTVSSGSKPNSSARPDDPNFDLARTIRGALDSSAALDQARRNIEIDQKRTNELEADERPNVSGTGSATRFDQATKISLGGSPPIEVIGSHTEALTLAVSQRLDFLGQVRATRNQAKLQEAADRYSVDSIRNERVLSATTFYFSLLRAIHQVQVAEAALRNARELQSIANRLYLGQIGQKIDVLRADTQVSQAEQDLTAAQNQRDIARESFNDLVGRPLNAPVVLLDTPGVTVGVDIPPASASAPVGSPATIPNFTPFADPVGQVTTVNLAESVQTAQTLRPEVLQSAVRVRESETGIRIARFGQEPSFALSASGNYYPTTSFQAPRQRTTALTATVTIPFYDGGATRNRIEAAKLQRENAQTALDSTREDVSLNVRQAYLNLSTAARQIRSANSALEQAVAARQLAQVRYEGQVGLYLEVTDAQAALVRAENAQVNAVYNYLIARAQFENALGAPRLPDPGTAVPAAPSSSPATTAPATPTAPAAPATAPAQP